MKKTVLLGMLACSMLLPYSATYAQVGMPVAGAVTATSVQLSYVATDTVAFITFVQLALIADTFFTAATDYSFQPMNAGTWAFSPTISGLMSSTAYRARSILIGNGGVNDTSTVPSTFTTLPPPPVDSIAPIMLFTNIGSITTNSASVTAVTNEPTDCKVFYGLTTSYTDSTSLSGLSNSHLVPLGPLFAGTTYHLSIRVRDTSGNVTFSNDTMFTTLGFGILSMNLIVNGATAQSTTSIYGMFSWLSNADSNWISVEATTDTVLLPNMVSNSILHGQPVSGSCNSLFTGLMPGTVYFVRLRGIFFKAGNGPQDVHSAWVACSTLAVSGITEVKDEERIISIFPNPVTDQSTISIDNPKGVTYEIIDMAGRIVSEFPAEGTTTTFAKGNLSPGMYALLIQTGNGKGLQKKIMIQ